MVSSFVNTMPGIGDIAGAGPGFHSLGVSTCERSSMKRSGFPKSIMSWLNVIFSAPVGLKYRGEHENLFNVFQRDLATSKDVKLLS